MTAIPDIMDIDPTPFKECPLGYVVKCNAYNFDPCLGCNLKTSSETKLRSS